MENKFFFKIADISKLFGVAIATVIENVRSWSSKGILRQKGKLVYLPDYVQVWERSYIKKNSNSKINDALKVVKFEKEKIGLEVLREKYADIESVKSEWIEAVSEFKQSVMVLEAKISDQLSAKTGKPIASVRTILHKETYMMLDNLYRKGKYRPKIKENMPIAIQQKTFAKFWDQMKNLPAKKYKRIDIEIKVK